MLLLLLAGTLASCGSDTSSEAAAGEGTAIDANAVDPASRAASTSSSTLSAEERQLLAKANGRTWEATSPAQLEAFLTAPADSTRAVILWEASSGADKLREVQQAVAQLDTAGISVAIAVLSGGNAEDELIDLRASQTVLPAFVLPAGGTYGFMPAGQLPQPGTLIVSGEAGGVPRVVPALGARQQLRQHFAGFASASEKIVNLVNLLLKVAFSMSIKFSKSNFPIMAFTFTDDNFDAEVINSKGVQVVDFWAEWCGPCRAIAPIIDNIASRYTEGVKVGKVDVDSNSEIAHRYSIRSIPTILIFKDGQMVDRHVGMISEPALAQKVEMHSGVTS